MSDIKRLLVEKLERIHKVRNAFWAYAGRLIKEKLNPVHRAHYAIWVYYWPLWRSIFSGRKILRHWKRFDLVQEGQTFLDYGCGTGWFTIAAANRVGTKGKVYALDCCSRYLKVVEKSSAKKALSNIEVILSDRETGLPDECVDVAWMCDVLHELHEKRAVLDEVHRVLKKGGILAIHDGMMDGVLRYTEDLLSLNGKDGKLLRLVKSNQT